MRQQARQPSCYVEMLFHSGAPQRASYGSCCPALMSDTSKSTSPLLKAIVTTHGWRERIIAGEIYSIEQLASEANLNPRYAARIFRMAALSPRWVDAVLQQVQSVIIR